MKRKIVVAAVAVVVILVACVTINVYFPEAAAERAADRFIQDVLGEDGAPMESLEPVGQKFQLSDLVISSAYAQSANIDISTPQIVAIKERMAERHRTQLATWYEAGAIGFGKDGLVEIRDRSAVGLSERRNLERVVAEDNADRNAVYREIALANGHPQWEEDIRQTFARQWIANARSGWYYRDANGEWVSK